MPSQTINDTRLLLQQSRTVADNADFLNLALLSGDQGRVEDAVNDLIAAYDGYTGQARTYGSRFGFDSVAQLAESEDRDQGTANAMAGALLDLEMAAVLGRFAQATGEIEGQASPNELDQAVSTLNETLKAIEGPTGTAPGATRFAFDEVTAPQPSETVASADVPTAKATYEQQVKSFYDKLVTESTNLLTETLKEAAGLDLEKIGQALKSVMGPLEGLPTGMMAKLAARAVDALKRGIETLKGILGKDLCDKIEERVKSAVESIRNTSLDSFLKYSYKYADGQTSIAGWLKESSSEQATIDGGTKALQELQQNMEQSFALKKRIIANLRLLSEPLEWLLKKFVGTLPLDMLLGGVFLVVVDIALLQGMDYADTTKIITFVDGVVLTSKRTLGIN